MSRIIIAYFITFFLFPAWGQDQNLGENFPEQCRKTYNQLLNEESGLERILLEAYRHTDNLWGLKGQAYSSAIHQMAMLYKKEMPKFNQIKLKWDQHQKQLEGKSTGVQIVLNEHFFNKLQLEVEEKFGPGISIEKSDGESLKLVTEIDEMGLQTSFKIIAENNLEVYVNQIDISGELVELMAFTLDESGKMRTKSVFGIEDKNLLLEQVLESSQILGVNSPLVDLEQVREKLHSCENDPAVNIHIQDEIRARRSKVLMQLLRKEFVPRDSTVNEVY